MCRTEIIFMERCGHQVAVWNYCNNIECLNHTQRMMWQGFCSDCEMDPSQIESEDVRQANQDRFTTRSQQVAAADERLDFAQELLREHLVSSIHPTAISTRDIREIVQAHTMVIDTIEDRQNGDNDGMEFWSITGRDPHISDLNRAIVLSAALFRVPIARLRHWRRTELGHYIDTLSADLEARRQTLLRDESKVARLRQVHASIPARDPMNRTRADREQTRIDAIPEILTEVDINTLQERDRVCLICMNPMGITQADVLAEQPSRLPPPCNHLIGIRCITEWLTTHNTCPLCRRDFAAELEQAQKGAQAAVIPVIQVDVGDEQPDVRREAGFQAEMAAGNPDAWQIIPISQEDEQSQMDLGEMQVALVEEPLGEIPDELRQEVARAREENRAHNHRQRELDHQDADEELRHPPNRVAVQQALEEQIQRREEEQAQIFPSLEEEIREWRGLMRDHTQTAQQDRRNRLEQLQTRLRADKLTLDNVYTRLEWDTEGLSRHQQILDELNEEWERIIAFNLRGLAVERNRQLEQAQDRLIQSQRKMRDRLLQAVEQGQRDVERLLADVEQCHMNIEGAKAAIRGDHHRPQTDLVEHQVVIAERTNIRDEPPSLASARGGANLGAGRELTLPTLDDRL